MAGIRILPEILANKIAAGEVIERPASVVKELLENALDADSSRILIELKNAGKSLMRVTDNGCGMNRDDAILAIERYATSKLSSDKDLFEIKTLGFRGEALPSIASVSRFTLDSRDSDSEVGTRILIEGGKIRDVLDIGSPVGTQMSVQDLFFNIPARRKFMKSADTEMGHIVDTVARIALAWPGVMFRLSHNGKTVKDWPSSAPIERAIDVLGSQMKGSLYPLRGAYNGIQLGGWVASARLARNTTRGIYLYVNHRFIRDRMIQHALLEGYRNRLMKGLFPVAVLFLTVPYEQVDVNVHPTKHEVRFADSQAVHQLIRAAVRAAIDRGEKPQWNIDPVDSPGVAESIDVSSPGAGPSHPETVVSSPSPPLDKPRQSLATVGNERTSPAIEIREPSVKTQPALWSEKQFGDLRIIGQFQDTYILCESKNRDLLLIDQHAAHERIRYEQLRAKQRLGQGAVQRLLVPETLELGFEESRILDGLKESLALLGMEIDPFGGNTYVVKSMPTMFQGGPIAPIIFELVERMADIGVDHTPEKALDQVHKLLACHRSLRANQRLSNGQIQTLLAQLDHCEHPSHCPHGRPTYIRWSLGEVEKAFRRIG